jgi:predicted ATP-dependent endonuclease of OLD family
MEYKKGSEWSRWDLHIHTPETKKNDQFEGTTPEEKWLKFIEHINGYPHAITVVGITDYYSIDNYFKFKDLLATGKITKPLSLVIPNIELRLVPVTAGSTPINIHCLFNPEFDHKVQERFLHKLSFQDGVRRITASKNDLAELGRNYKNNTSLDFESAITEGIRQFTVSIGDLMDLFNADIELRANTIIVVSNKSNDGASGLRGHAEIIEGAHYSSLDATRLAIYRLTDGLFTAMPKDVLYFLGEGTDSPAEVKRKCSGLKPCFHGSDAHKNVELFEPEKKRYCWIKANPTFSGLRQTLFEPATRVRIQEDKPEQKKNYLVIDSVQFRSDLTKKQFSQDTVEMNDKLNAIIGGKSSGKSLLLYYIAKAVDPRQVDRKFEELDIPLGYDFEKAPDFDFQVTWRDGLTNSLREPESGKTRQITYVPQMYINYLAEKRGKDGLKSLIQSFLEEKKLFADFLSEANKERDKAKQDLTSSITQYFLLTDQLRKTSDNIKSKGDKQARIKNLTDKEKDLADLRAIAGFSEEDERNFGLLDAEKKRLAGRQLSLELLYTNYQTAYPAELRRIQRQVEDSFDSFSRTATAKFTLHPRVGSGLSSQFSIDKGQVTALFKVLIAESLAKAVRVQALVSTIAEKAISCDLRLQPFLNKIQNREKLRKLQEEIAAERLGIDQIFELEKEMVRLTDGRRDEYEKTKTIYSTLMQAYVRIVNEINQNPAYSEISSEKKIKLKAFIDFNNDRFNAACTNLINKQSYFSTLFGTFFNDANQYLFDPENHLKNFDQMFVRIQTPATHNIRFNQGGTAESISRGLLDDYFSVNFELSQDGEDILKMSPGKKGLILLFLMLHLSNADFPILIDQPEDNLDNRTVYTELKDFMKAKKIERQIIIVTHNANLVVPTDAENVIVANQDGQDQGKENRVYRFEYRSGAIEESFRNEKEVGILNQMGIKEHVCEVLEGGEAAFIEREKRYSLPES